MSTSPSDTVRTGQPRCFVLVAGEASGDLLGAGLIRALQLRYPDAQFVGIGGPQMIKAGLTAGYPAEKLSVMGLVEVLAHLPQLLGIRRRVRARTLALRPDCFIGIDAPDFNLGLERKLKQAGIRTVHYVSPSIWAWREKRATRMRLSADLVLCLFPMEPAIYARHGVNAQFVGHPLAEQFALLPDRAAARSSLGLSTTAPLLAVLPGSRLGEIQRLAPVFIQAVLLLRRDLPNLQVVLPAANPACRAALEAILARLPAAEVPTGMRILDGEAHAAMIGADAVLLASGTAALEAMLAKTPMVVAYRLAALTYRIVTGLRLLKTQFYALPNILAARPLVPELMQADCSAQNLRDALLPPLRTRHMPVALFSEFTRLHRELMRDADQAAAAAIVDLLHT